MYDNMNSGYGYGGGANTIWVLFLFLLVFLWGGPAFGRGADGRYGTTNECSPMHNHGVLNDLRCDQGKNFALVEGDLNTMSRTILNQINVGTATVIDAQKDQRIRELETRNMEMYIQAQNEQTRNMMLQNQAAMDRRIDHIQCTMLQKPPVYPTVCVPCSQPTGCCGM